MAIILANLATETAFEMVYNLGRVLAKREYHAAADFCFLAVSLLANYDPFQPVIVRFVCRVFKCIGLSRELVVFNCW